MRFQVSIIDALKLREVVVAVFECVTNKSRKDHTLLFILFIKQFNAQYPGYTDTSRQEAFHSMWKHWGWLEALKLHLCSLDIHSNIFVRRISKRENKRECGLFYSVSLTSSQHTEKHIKSCIPKQVFFTRTFTEQRERPWVGLVIWTLLRIWAHFRSGLLGLSSLHRELRSYVEVM